MTPFSGINHSLARGNNRLILIWLFVLGLLLLAWFGWFFLAQVSLYDTSSYAQLVQVSSAATFKPTTTASSTNTTTFTTNTAIVFKIESKFQPQVAVSDVKPGQIVQVNIDGFSNDRYHNLKAIVSSVGSNINGDGSLSVVLLLQVSPSLNLQPGLLVTVKIETAKVSPATLVWRAINQTSPNS